MLRLTRSCATVLDLYAWHMAKDWTALYKKYKGKWVALAADEITVLAVGKTAKDAFFAARKQTDKTPFLTRIPETLTSYVGAYEV